MFRGGIFSTLWSDRESLLFYGNGKTLGKWFELALEVSGINGEPAWSLSLWLGAGHFLPQARFGLWLFFWLKLVTQLLPFTIFLIVLLVGRPLKGSRTVVIDIRRAKCCSLTRFFGLMPLGVV